MGMFLMWVAAIGACIVIIMATFAFGPSGFGFSVVLVVAAFMLMRYRYRFSLRTFLVATALIAMWLGLKVKFDVAHQHAVTTITSAGGKFSVHDRSSNFPWGIWAERYDISLWRLDRPASAEVFKSLTDLRSPSVYWLELANSGITDESVRYVRNLRGIEFLSLANETYYGGALIPNNVQNKITDTGLDQLRGLSSLRGVDLAGTDATDQVLDVVTTMPNLMWIKLDGTHVTGANASRLCQLKFLASLDMNGCHISSEGFRELSKLPQVGSLGLNNTELTDADLDALSNLPNISLIRVGMNKISNEAKHRFVVNHPNCRIE
jgi:hypothetical protein